MMGDEDDNKSQDGIWGKWQTIVAILTLGAAAGRDRADCGAGNCRDGAGKCSLKTAA
jgi:hypothetical protein